MSDPQYHRSHGRTPAADAKWGEVPVAFVSPPRHHHYRKPDLPQPYAGAISPDTSARGNSGSSNSRIFRARPAARCSATNSKPGSNGPERARFGYIRKFLTSGTRRTWPSRASGPRDRAAAPITLPASLDRIDHHVAPQIAGESCRDRRTPPEILLHRPCLNASSRASSVQSCPLPASCNVGSCAPSLNMRCRGLLRTHRRAA